VNALHHFGYFQGIRHVVNPLQRLDRRLVHIMLNGPLHRWRISIILGSCMSSLVLRMYTIFLVLCAKRGRGFENRFAVPISGLVEDMSRWSGDIHILINALSTLLLAARNYTMEVLSPTTRKDVDKAHTRHEHLDVRFLNVRNLSRIPRRQLLLFIFMGSSSVPMHLLQVCCQDAHNYQVMRSSYDSAVFYIGAKNEYDFHVIERSSNAYNNTYVSNSSYDLIDGDVWFSIYQTFLVSYGMLILAVDEHRSENIKKILSRRPEK
jgi:hypothetical protein